jgi:hypothetical protein
LPFVKVSTFSDHLDRQFPMILPFRTADGSPFLFTVPDDATLAQVKTLLETERNWNAADLRFISSCRVLDDSKLVKDLRLPSDSSIMIHITAHRTPTVEIPPEPSDDTPLEPFTPTEISGSSGHGHFLPAARDPEDFEEMVDQLVEMGFSRNQSENALRATRYRLANAIDRIFAGDFPNEAGDVEPPGPVENRQRRYDFGDLQPNFQELSEENRQALLTLMETSHVDPQTALQVFFACEMDVETSAALLESMS